MKLICAFCFPRHFQNKTNTFLSLFQNPALYLPTPLIFQDLCRDATGNQRLSTKSPKAPVSEQLKFHSKIPMRFFHQEALDLYCTAENELPIRPKGRGILKNLLT